jgi:thiamine kinase-like enzyme
LSIPVIDEILEVGCLADRYLSTVYESVYSKPPLTLTDNDKQGENLFISDDERPSVVMIDWQLTTPAWGALDLASSLACQLEPNHRRSSEKQLIETYHSALTARGIGGYSLERCQQDYRTSLLIPATRLATAVGWDSRIKATPGAFWDGVFPRIAEAIGDLRVGEVLEHQFG